MHRYRHAAFAAALCSLALPAASSAATKTVVAGPPVKKAPAGTPKDADFNAFYPRTIKVNAGDTLKFQIAGFHTINFPKNGQARPSLELLDASTPVSGIKDAAGADFWFNGQPSFMVNPAVFFGTKSGGAYDGKKAAQSGAPLSEGPPKPWSVKLTKAGTFTYYCPIHPGMQGKVTVVGKGKKVPSAKADAKRAKADYLKAVAAIKKADKAAAPAGDVVTAGPDSPKTGAILYRFTPADKTVKVNTPVTLTMTPGTTETHTFTFAKDLKSLEPLAQIFIGPRAGTGQNGPPVLEFASQALYRSDTTLPAYDGSQHGDGFLNTGTLDGDPKTAPPTKATVTFSAPGTYEYLCLVHPDMKGKITVTQ